MRRRRTAALVLAAGLAVAPASGQGSAEAPSIVRELDAVRDLLVALNIERALAAVNDILERPGLSDAQRVDALDLRAQAHAASDDLTAVEKDFRAILELAPGYAPERAVTSKKALARFVKIRAAMIGTIQLIVDPRDAELAVDGRPAPISAAGTLMAIAGERRLRFTRAGFDTLETTARALAGQETLVKIQMIPNARTLVVRTDIDGVAVALDGVPVGVSARKGGASESDAAAELVIENAAIGEHEIRLRKSCYADETLHEIVSADLTDRSLKVLRVAAMRPARTRVVATGAAYEGELRVDGERVASMPLKSFSTCPGDRKIEVFTSGRIVWSGQIAAEEADLTLDLTPRPNVTHVGPHAPAAWAAVEAGWSVGVPLPVPDGADLSTSDGWRGVALPPGTDLALAVIPGRGPASDELVVLYSPALHEVEAPAAPPTTARPLWRRATVGAVLVDDASGSVVIAAVAAGSPAAQWGLAAGDRLVSVAGRPVTTAAAANDVVEKAAPRATLVLEVASPGGAPRKIECPTSTEIRYAPPKGAASRVVLAAWASVDAIVSGPDGAIALACLATLLDQAGNEAAAFEAWRRVMQTGSGPLAARAAYAVGAGLQAQGKQAEAIEVFGRARSEASSRGDVALAAAAGDRLADLGVTGR